MTEKEKANLIDEAKRVSANAYAKYSGFRVGAAILDENGEIFSGCNVENISFGLTICAERSAVFKAVSQGSKKIKAVVIYTPTDTPTPPCGACRQVLAEFNSNMQILSVCDTKEMLYSTLGDLLPNSSFPLNT